MHVKKSGFIPGKKGVTHGRCVGPLVGPASLPPFPSPSRKRTYYVLVEKRKAGRPFFRHKGPYLPQGALAKLPKLDLNQRPNG